MARLDWLDSIAVHHGSIDAIIRRRVEDRLKAPPVAMQRSTEGRQMK